MLVGQDTLTAAKQDNPRRAILSSACGRGSWLLTRDLRQKIASCIGAHYTTNCRDCLVLSWLYVRLTPDCCVVCAWLNVRL